MSHPMWVRGLKQKWKEHKYHHIVVAPYVGAWIETTKHLRQLIKKLVAPYVGAWIETFWRRKNDNRGTSHPMWVRGLKPAASHREGQRTSVAPYMGVWIETLYP